MSKESAAIVTALAATVGTSLSIRSRDPGGIDLHLGTPNGWKFLRVHVGDEVFTLFPKDIATALKEVTTA